MRRSWRRAALVVVFGTVGALGACDLNPQPLPPLDPENQATGGADDAGAFGSRGDASTTPPPEPSDAGSLASDGGEDDAGDSGEDDAGDGGEDDAGDGGPT